MNNEINTSSSRGIGFIGLLTLLFIALKLLNKIDWSWWWVLSPMWISIGIGLSVLLIFFIIIGLLGLFK